MVTDNRKTHVRYDVDDLLQEEPYFSLTRNATEVGRVPASQMTNAIEIDGVGIMIKPFWEELHFLTERQECDDSFVGAHNGTAQLAPGFLSILGYRAPTNAEFPGVSIGANPNLLPSGYHGTERSTTAGADRSQHTLSADLSAFSQPQPDTDNMVLDRVFVSNDVDEEDTPILFGFFIPGGFQQSPGKFITLYFNAKAGWNNAAHGSGRYSCCFLGDGRAKLYELDNGDLTGNLFPVWKLRFTFRYSASNELAGRFHVVTIYKKECKTGASHVILFRLNGPDGDTEVSQYMSHHHLDRRSSSKANIVYHIPKTENVDAPTTRSQIRVDLRRDLKSVFVVAKYRGPKLGSVQDDLFSLGFIPTDRVNIVLQWGCCIPAGSKLSVDCKLFTKDGVECTQVSTDVNSKTYSTPAGVQYYYVGIYINGTLRTSSVFKYWIVSREPYTQVNSPGEKEYKLWGGKLSITGPERDPSHENASFGFSNLEGNADALLGVRSHICTVIETEYTDPLGAQSRVKLFRGYSQKAVAARVGHTKPSPNTDQWPSPHWKKYEIDFLGVWQRIHEQVTRQLFIFIEGDGLFDRPMKVTDALTQLAHAAGIPDSMIDFPSQDIRLFSQGGDNRIQIDPLSTIGDVMLSMIKDYLGSFLVFDPTAGNYGKLRLIDPTFAPYTNTKAFITGDFFPNSLTAPFEIMNVHSYPLASTLGDGQIYTATAPTIPIIKGTLKTYVKGPDANMIVVSALGDITPGGSPSMLTQVLVNPASFNFGIENTADPTSPDYLGYCLPMFVMNPALSANDTQEQKINALNWVARRVYDVVAHGTKVADFQAPFVPVAHDEVGKYRKDRFYDPFTINGQQFLCRNFNPAYEKDHIQVGMYQAEAPRF